MLFGYIQCYLATLALADEITADLNGSFIIF